MSNTKAQSGTFRDINGTSLWVADTGEANLPVILCLHSCFLDGTMFDGLVSAADGKFRVVRPDFRGQGKAHSTRSTSLRWKNALRTWKRSLRQWD